MLEKIGLGLFDIAGIISPGSSETVNLAPYEILSYT